MIFSIFKVLIKEINLFIKKLINRNESVIVFKISILILIFISSFLIYNILINFFFSDVISLASGSTWNLDGLEQNSGPIGPTWYKEYPVTVEPPKEFSAPTGQTAKNIYLANRPKGIFMDPLLKEIQEVDPNFFEWLGKRGHLTALNREVEYSFYHWEGKSAALQAGHLENSPGFNEYVNKYTAYYLKLSKKFNRSGSSWG